VKLKASDIEVADFVQAVGLLVRRVRAAAASQELSWSEASALGRIAKEGPATTADLARTQGMRPQSMRTILATLEELGMVERTPHATDGRQVMITLTAKGAAAHKSSSDAKRTWVAQAIDKLEDQDRETLFAAGKIIKRLAESGQS
jgi:DNA-binding MarR family transcriptional regulator